jgi:hypothetical protein
MSLKKALFGDSTKYSFLDKEELADNRFTFILIPINYFIVWVIWGLMVVFSWPFLYWFTFLLIAHLYIIILLLLKLNNFAFMAMNTYLKEREKKK